VSQPQRARWQFGENVNDLYTLITFAFQTVNSEFDLLAAILLLFSLPFAHWEGHTEMVSNGFDVFGD